VIGKINSNNKSTIGCGGKKKQGFVARFGCGGQEKARILMLNGMTKVKLK
jgi:ribosomal protein S6E (S10)